MSDRARMHVEEATSELPQVTYRCRVFLVMEDEQTGRGAYTEVWETDDAPMPDERLPRGEPVIDIEDTSRIKVRHQVTEAECAQGIRYAGYWNGGGA